MVKASRSKPKKPYPAFPLTAHANGQWCKKIRGKVHFFGVWAEPEKALRQYLAQASDLHEGRPPQTSKIVSGGLTVKETCNQYLNWQREKLKAGEIGDLWFGEGRTMIRAFAKAMGKERLVADLAPQDFQRYRMRLARRLGVHALARQVTAIRSLFKYAYETDLIDRPMKFGAGFSGPRAVQVRKARSKRDRENGKRLFSAEQIQKILDASAGVMKACVLLGINGGFGNVDCAMLPISAIDLKDAVVDFERPKTGVQRTVPLWAETVKALAEAMTVHRPTPVNDEAKVLALLSPGGRPMVRKVLSGSDAGQPEKIGRVDWLFKAFRKTLEDSDLYRPRIGFYTLRHTFRTWADEAGDQHAIHRVMGHAIPGMSGIYVEEISMARLRAIVDRVHDKLYASQ